MELILNDQDMLTELVSEYFDITSLTVGGPNQNYVIRYIGKLRKDSEYTHLSLTDRLVNKNLLVILRNNGDLQEILFFRSPVSSKQSKIWLNLLLFFLTFLSVLFAGALFNLQTDPFMYGFSIATLVNFLAEGLPFTVGFLPILAAHEFGHYIAGRLHKVNVSLPYFIPFPLSMVGTMGAFINMKEPPKNKKHLLDIAIAGPISGLIIAIPVLLIGLSMSTVNEVPVTIPENMSFQIEGNSILYLLSKYLVFGRILPQPASFGDVHPLVYWIKFFFTGRPLPLGGADVMIHPVAWAGWVGLMITMSNLIPAGQLDGGHILHTLFGKKVAKNIRMFVIFSLFVLGIFWNGWWLWAGLILFFGAAYAEPLDQITMLDRKRKFLAIIVLIIFFLIFMPVPLIIASG